MTPATLVIMHVGASAARLIATLAGYTPRMSAHEDAKHDRDNREALELMDQAKALSMPVEDWEAAARLDGGVEEDGCWADRYDHFYGSAREYCEENEIEPEHREVSEHWIVSAMLADRLIAHGEKVDKDFAGLCIWARCRLGTLTDDPAIVKIAADWK